MKGLGSPKLVTAALLGALAGAFGVKPLQQQVADKARFELALGDGWLKGERGLRGVRMGRGKGRGTPSRRYGNKSGHMPHQGKRECARRRRQIARFILTASNGLVVTPKQRRAA